MEKYNDEWLQGVNQETTSHIIRINTEAGVRIWQFEDYSNKLNLLNWVAFANLQIFKSSNLYPIRTLKIQQDLIWKL